jgi:hypothetical protein
METPWNEIEVTNVKRKWRCWVLTAMHSWDALPKGGKEEANNDWTRCIFDKEFNNKDIKHM